MKEKKNKEKDEFHSFYVFMCILAAMVVVIMGFAVAGFWYTATTAKTETKVYPLLTTVTEVDRDKDLVTVKDNNGFIWQFEGADDWEEGDLCNCLMNSKGTEKIFDDEIIMTKYESGARQRPFFLFQFRLLKSKIFLEFFGKKFLEFFSKYINFLKLRVDIFP